MADEFPKKYLRAPAVVQMLEVVDISNHGNAYTLPAISEFGAGRVLCIVSRFVGSQRINVALSSEQIISPYYSAGQVLMANTSDRGIAVYLTASHINGEYRWVTDADPGIMSPVSVAGYKYVVKYDGKTPASVWTNGTFSDGYRWWYVQDRVPKSPVSAYISRVTIPRVLYGLDERIGHYRVKFGLLAGARGFNNNVGENQTRFEHLDANGTIINLVNKTISGIKVINGNVSKVGNTTISQAKKELYYVRNTSGGSENHHLIRLYAYFTTTLVTLEAYGYSYGEEDDNAFSWGGYHPDKLEVEFVV
jgi:hypothetical protein